MRPPQLLATASIGLVAAACGSTPAPPLPRGTHAEISNYSFHPYALTIRVGASVTFTNRDATAHTATEASGPVAFDTGTLIPRKSTTITFTRPGSYTYYCQFHAFMRGTIVVTG